MKIITISGLDGSGKSTQVEKLKEYLESQGTRVVYFHAIQHSFAKKLKDFRHKYCLMCKVTVKHKNPSIEEKSVVKANTFQIFLRKVFLLIDIFRFKVTYHGTLPGTYQYLLSDRYFYDGVINISYLSGKKKEILAEKFIPVPDKAIYLEAEPALIMQRTRVPDQGIEYLREKRDLFDQYAKKWNMQKIDGNRNEDEIFEEIKSFV